MTNKMEPGLRKELNNDRRVAEVRTRYCDVPMARRKGYFPCEQNCSSCNACIEVLFSGEKRHVSMRNMK